MIESFGSPAKKPVRPSRPLQIAAIAMVRDPLLAAQIQAEASVAGALAAQQTNLQNAGDCLKKPLGFCAAPNGLNGLAAGLSNLFESFQRLSIDPADHPLRRDVVRSAQDVVAQFNCASFRLDNVKKDLNASIQKDAAQVNQALRDIAGLNKRIMTSRTSGATAAPLARQRERFLEALSRSVSITVAPQTGGSINLSISGVTMVCGAETPDHLAAHTDKHGNFRIQAQNAGTRLKLAGGGIAGKITVRDGALASLHNGLHNLASQLIVSVNSVYKSGSDLSGGKGRDFFTGSDASDIGVNPIVAHDPSRLQAEGAVLTLAALGSRNVSGLGNQTFVQCYDRTVSALDNTLSSVNDDLSGSQAVNQMLTHERGASRVASLADAGTALKRYEQASAATAKMIAILDEMPSMW